MLPKAEGVHYIDFFRDLHEAILFDWYLEIGSRKGDSFAPVRGKTIAVDPYFRLRRHVMNVKRTLLLCQTTSDEFFADDALGRLGIQLSFSFLDGMHLFEYLLRDFMNTEAHSRPDGVIAMHDCCPFTTAMTTRDLENLPRGAWTGDVWKLIPILRDYRPDLTIRVLDAAPTGLVLVSGLDPQNRVLQENYDDIIARFSDLDLDSFGPQRFGELFTFESTRAMIDSGFEPFRHLALDPALVSEPKRVST